MDELEIIEGIYGPNMKRFEHECGYLLEYSDSNVCLKLVISEQFPNELQDSLKFVVAVQNNALKKKLLTDKLQRFVLENMGNLDGILFRIIEFVKETSFLLNNKISDFMESDNVSEESFVHSSKIDATEFDTDVIGKFEMQIIHGSFITIKKSVFQAHCCALRDVNDVEMFRYIVLQDRKVT